MIRSRQRLAAGLSILLATAAVTMALAQPRGRARPKPKPGAVDGGDNPYEDTAAPQGSAAPSPGSTTPGDAGGGPVPAPRGELGDGGIRPSPLNPAANEMPPAPGAAPAASASASAPGVDYDKLLADIAALRARVAAVGDNLFTSRISIAAQTDGGHAKVARFLVSLDDGVVYTGAAGFHADDPMVVYEHAVAPGRHAVTVDVDRRDERDDSFRTSQRSRFVVDVPKDQRLTVTLRLGDDSSMGADFPGDRKGKYDLRVRMKAVATPATQGAPKR
jgi:hypothetical protein